MRLHALAGENAELHTELGELRHVLELIAHCRPVR
jgi:hypothetical protein